MAYFRQAPAAQRPSLPQLAAPWSTQLPEGSGLPVGTLVQVPSVVDSAQDWQAPPQAELQQTPCEQKPVTHSASLEHNAGGTFNPQEFETQLFGCLH